MLRQLMIYYIKVYSLPRSQAMRFDLKHQSHCLSCIFSQKIQFAFVDCSSICKQCLCIYIQRLKHAWHCKFAVRILLVGMQSQSLRTSRNRDGCALLWSAERAFCKNAKPASARGRTTGLGCAQQALARQGALYIQRHCLQESFGVPKWYHEALLAEAIASI